MKKLIGYHNNQLSNRFLKIFTISRPKAHDGSPHFEILNHWELFKKYCFLIISLKKIYTVLFNPFNFSIQ